MTAYINSLFVFYLYDVYNIDSKFILSTKKTEMQKALSNSMVDSSPDLIAPALDTIKDYLFFNDLDKVAMKVIYGVDIEIGMNFWC